VKQIYIGGLAW